MKILINCLCLFVCISLSNCVHSQYENHMIETKDPKFSKKIDSYLKFDVPVISVEELYDNYDEYIILDTREKEEYTTSHLKGARFLDYSDPDWSSINTLPKNKKILVYCSIGYRSEKIGRKIKEKGFEVYNLYGSIFEWVNNEYPIFDRNELPTKELHTYNRSWSRWVQDPTTKKIY